MIPIKIKQGSVVDEDVDAIVCSANNWLILGSGVAGEIKAHGGPAIQNECNQIIQNNGGGPVEIGGAFCTSAGSFMNTKKNLKYIIHAVGMGYKIKKENDLFDRILATPESVFQAVTNTLAIADQMGIQSIAFPLMCARPGYSNLEAENGPKEMLATMMKAIESHVPVGTSLSKVIICTGT